MKEELDVEVSVGRLLWVAENFYEFEGDSWHELSLYYLVSFPDGDRYYELDKFHGIEDDGRLLFKWHRIQDSEGHKTIPNVPYRLCDLPETTVHILHHDIDA